MRLTRYMTRNIFEFMMKNITYSMFLFICIFFISFNRKYLKLIQFDISVFAFKLFIYLSNQYSQ